MIKTVLFDLDGTLLPMDNDEFTEYYFKLLCRKLAPFGFDASELVDAAWKGTAAMVKNDGSATNEVVFWKKFSEIIGDDIQKARPVIDEFYSTDFNEAKIKCGYNQQLVDLVHSLKDRGFCVALATNPVFPALGTENRIRWAGLEPSDFELYTTYENMSCAKPNLEYYREILRRLGAKAEETLMVGNDVNEDMVASEIGMKVFLLTDCLLNKSNKDISKYPHGSVKELYEMLA